MSDLWAGLGECRGGHLLHGSGEQGKSAWPSPAAGGLSLADPREDLSAEAAASVPSAPSGWRRLVESVAARATKASLARALALAGPPPKDRIEGAKIAAAAVPVHHLPLAKKKETLEVEILVSVEVATSGEAISHPLEAESAQGGRGAEAWDPPARRAT